MTRWCVAITSPRAERIAKRQFADAGIDCFLPLRERPPTLATPVIVEPIWPGYVFVCTRQIPMRPSGETLVRAAHRLIATRTGDPILTPAGLVEAMIAKADSDGLLERYEPPPPWIPRVREVVRLLYGHFAGQFGEIRDVFGERLKIALACQSGQLVVRVKSEQVAPVS